MTKPPVSELLVLLAHRGALLDRLHDGVHDRRTLVTELDVSRSTVNRGIRDLQEAGLVDDRPDGFALTRYGRFSLDVYRTADQLVEAEPLLDRLPENVPLGTIRDAEIVFSEHPVPQRPLEDILGLIDDATDVVALAPVVIPALVESTIERVQAGELTATVVVDETVLEGLWNERAEVMDAGLNTDGYTLLATEREISFGLLVADDRLASIGVHDDSGRLLGILLNHDRATVEWALDTFETYRRSAEEVAPLDV